MLGKPGVIQRLADGGHAPVHHVAGRDDIGAGAGVRNRGLGQPLQRSIVIHFAIDDLAAMAVAGVLAVANVGDHQQVGQLAFDGADGLLHDAIIGVRARGLFVLCLRHAEQDDAADPEPHALRRTPSPAHRARAGNCRAWSRFPGARPCQDKRTKEE